MITPWLFEGIELTKSTIDHLYIEKIPFDHPSHTVLSKRADRYRDPFMEYNMPRAKYRLYRIVRTFCKQASPDAKVVVIDDRLETKSYGASLLAYLKLLTSKEVQKLDGTAPQKTTDEDEAQQSLF